MKKLIFYLTAFTIFATPLFAQDKDDEDDKSSRTNSYWSKTKIGGAGGVTPIIGMFDNKNIDKMLSIGGVPTIGSDPIYMVGGEGYGYIMFLKNVRMGGFGASGNKTVSSIQPILGGGNLRKETDYKISYGGFLIDYVQPVAYRLDVAVGASIGGGEMNFTMRRDDGGFGFNNWDTLWIDYGNTSSKATSYTRNLKGAFAVFNPHINIEYTLLTWLQLRIGAGYPILFSPKWTLDEKYEINNVPSNIKTSGYTINAGIMFGFFGW